MSKVIRYRGPRATIQAPEGRYFVAFDADGLHLRIASTASQDPFMLGSLMKYDETNDVHYKPHIQNMSALFGMDLDECIELMEVESPKYTFSKNFIYMLLNGGDVPALKNAAVSAGLVMNEKEVKYLLDRWLERAIKFHKWRLSLVDEAKKTGCVTMPSGRRRRFYGIRYDPRTINMY
jgi:DNA polymerase I-like protein with 3'-5' exonuclease and polymerase domains